MKLFVLTLLVAGSIATHGDAREFGREQRHRLRRSTDSGDPLAGCESCLNSKLTVGNTFAGHCFPNPAQGECHCLCADVFCKDGETIDRTTCVNGGSISDCKCTGTSVFVTTSTATPTDV
ncbi:uncharacterized protein LOC119085766 isoform X2 [Bradysia coprophila]|uniref:uncharacterized protein LOC119085766 isoform X2 n=1 Tax=Bradysia coprophila TaxID=38358 RepID=UPI00187DA9B8|nr:uncharacterized protein LOC119085766 isoform X2 [Bradysia coprophila]